MTRYTHITITRTIAVQHNYGGEEPKAYTMYYSEQIGNFNGHWQGVEVTQRKDGTYTVILRADQVQQWSGIPADAIQFGKVLETIR